MYYKIVDMPRQRFLAITRNFSIDVVQNDDNREIPDFWDECDKNQSLAQLLKLCPKGAQDVCGLCSIPEENDTTFEYGIGIRLHDATDAFFLSAMSPTECRIWTLEPSKYVVFECVGDDSKCIDETWAKFYTHFLPDSPYRATRTPDIEVYPEKEKPGVFCELWIPITEQKEAHL